MSPTSLSGSADGHATFYDMIPPGVETADYAARLGNPAGDTGLLLAPKTLPLNVELATV